MKFTVSKRDILDVLVNVQGLTGRKSNLAITSTILIKTSDSGITIVVTDLETGFEGFYPASVESDGVITINARKFYEIVRDFPSQEISIKELENYWVKISNENVEYSIAGMNPEDFPDTPKIEDVQFFDIDSAVFKKMIDKTVIISGLSDEKRAHITGAYFEIINKDDDKKIRMVSTDGNRLSRVDYVYENESELPPATGIIVPKKGLNEVNKFLSPEGTVKVGIKGNNFIIKKDNETIIIRLLEGNFPEYRDILTQGDSHTIPLEKKLFLMMLKRMSILSSEDYKGVIFDFSEDKLVVTASNPDVGESKESMVIDFKGETINVAFNPKYFTETISVIEDDTVILDIIDQEKPCFIKGDSDKTFISVIMPMRI
ncbi:MAG: DNA polymerase III subunit beta [Deltaproteobacteria bacterium]|nr:DNA polymerase III subunit beta [Deltaproteobacteria bacterium]